MKNIFIILSVVFISFSCNKKGCTDPLAINYSSNATKDDNSCEYSISNKWMMNSYIINGNNISDEFEYYKMYSYIDSSFWVQSLTINDTTISMSRIIQYDSTYTIQYDSTYNIDTLFTVTPTYPFSSTTIVDTTVTIVVNTTITISDTLIYDTLIYDSLFVDIVGNYSLSNLQSEIHFQNESIRTNSNLNNGNNWETNDNSESFEIITLTDSVMHLLLTNSSNSSTNSLEISYFKEI